MIVCDKVILDANKFVLHDIPVLYCVRFLTQRIKVSLWELNHLDGNFSLEFCLVRVFLRETFPKAIFSKL